MEDLLIDQINVGCYVFECNVIDWILQGWEVLVECEVFLVLFVDGDCKIYGYVDVSYWWDMGILEDFVCGLVDLVCGIVLFLVLCGYCGEQLVYDGVVVFFGVLLIGGIVVGCGVEIGFGIRLDGVVIFDGVWVEVGCVIECLIIGFGVCIGLWVLICDGVIGDGVDIGVCCELLSGVWVWFGVFFFDGGICYLFDV